MPKKTTVVGMLAVFLFSGSVAMILDWFLNLGVQKRWVLSLFPFVTTFGFFFISRMISGKATGWASLAGSYRMIVLALICVVTSAAIFGSSSATILSRLSQPFRRIPLTQLSTEIGDVKKKVGESLHLEVTVRGKRPRVVTLKIELKDGSMRDLELEVPAGVDSVSHEFESLEESFQYYFKAADGATPVHHVTVEP